jgi:clan AA aspartic protease
MIVGVVRGREAYVRLTLLGSRGRQLEIDALVDSGYTGWLTLPSAITATLNLPWETTGRGVLADGSVSAFDVYRAKVIWDGRARSIFVDEFDATPLIGMSMLRGFEYRMEVRARGPVTIKRIRRN